MGQKNLACPRFDQGTYGLWARRSSTELTCFLIMGINTDLPIYVVRGSSLLYMHPIVIISPWHALINIYYFHHNRDVEMVVVDEVVPSRGPGCKGQLDAPKPWTKSKQYLQRGSTRRASDVSLRPDRRMEILEIMSGLAMILNYVIGGKEKFQTER